MLPLLLPILTNDIGQAGRHIARHAINAQPRNNTDQSGGERRVLGNVDVRTIGKFRFKRFKLHTERSKPADQLQPCLAALVDPAGVGDRLRHQVAIAPCNRATLVDARQPVLAVDTRLRAVGLRGVMPCFPRAC